MCLRWWTTRLHWGPVAAEEAAAPPVAIDGAAGPPVVADEAASRSRRRRRNRRKASSTLQDLQGFFHPSTTSTDKTPLFSFCPLMEAEVSKLLLSRHPTTCPLVPIPSHLLQAISPTLLPAGACLVFWGPSASVPGGAPLGGFCDRFWGRDGYRLNFIDTDMILINTVIHTTLYNLVHK